VKNSKWWPWVGVVALGALLAGCGGSGGDSSGNASLRVANATLTHASLDLLVNASSSAATAVASDTTSAYVTPASGSVTLQLNDAGSSTALATTVPTLTGGNHYTLLAYESGGAVKTVVLNEDYTLPTSGAAQLRVYDAAPEAGAIDIYVTDPSTDLATVSAPTVSLGSTTGNQTTSLLTYSPGTYRVRVTAAGSKTDLRADIPNVVLESQQIATVALTPTVGGSLMNGSTLIQQGTYSAARNTNTRVRLAGAVANGVTVAASTGSTPIDSGVSPTFGFAYTLVPAGSALNITVGGQSVGAPATALAAGADVTLLVYQDGGAAVASQIADDNRAPTDATTVKLRMLNGVTGGPGALTLTANNTPVGVATQPGAASGYASIAGSTNATAFGLVSSSVNIPAPTPGTSPLTANKVYSVLVGGTAAAPQLLIR
jgi:hypothetical protein